MMATDTTMIWVKVPKEIKDRLEALKAVDKVLYSQNRVAFECVREHLAQVEQRAGIFQDPTKKTSGRRPKRDA